MIFRVFVILIALFALSGCKEETTIVPPPYQPTSAYDGYRHGLVEAGLGNSKLAKAWLSEGEICLNSPTHVRLPYSETKRGQKIEMQLSIADSIGCQAFLDLYRVTNDTLDPYIHVASADSTRTLGFEPLVDGEYILRLQPELLESGRFKLEIKEVTVFEFPMAERDAGKRIHEGNDIFAARHTPIIAATSGVISYAGEKGLGGKQIYIRDDQRDLAVYFAHLEDIFVKDGDIVQKGDTIGTNGNSGNAATTNPHLHFGIYAEEGAIDPYHYIVPNRREEREIKSDPTWTGKLVRTRNKAYFDNVNYRYRNLRDSVPIHTIMTAHAAWSRSYRVTLPDGREGYVRSGDLTLAEEPFRNRKADEAYDIVRAIGGDIVEGEIGENERYQVLGRFDGREYVRYGDVEGWRSTD